MSNITVSRQPLFEIDAAPTKRLYAAIMADYDLNKGICELIDNAFDAWMSNGAATPLQVEVNLDPDQKSIRVLDNAGGVDMDGLRALVSPGESRGSPLAESIGFFGVGSKRAAVALAEEIRITTRAKDQSGYRIAYGDEWLTEKDNNWTLPVYAVDDAPECVTCLDLLKLRIPLSEDNIERLRIHLAEVYGHFIRDGQLSLIMDMVAIEPNCFNAWAYPSTFQPRIISITVPSKHGLIKVAIKGGLMTTASPVGDYGVYVYCNKRLVASRLKTIDVGFSSGQAGKPHASCSLMRIEVHFSGPPAGMPWNSSKSDLSVQHFAFRNIQPNLINAASYWATLSRRFEGTWTTKVRPFSEGTAIHEVETLGKPTRSYFPDMPRARPPSFAEQMEKVNEKQRRKRPWVAGLTDGLVAVSVIRKNRRIHHRNRIALILLDSTLEIAFKDYLVNETSEPPSEAALVKLNRQELQKKFAEHVKLPDGIWKQVDYYYRNRCKLVHERAHSGIDDSEIEAQTRMVATILSMAFSITIDTKSI